MAVISKEIIIFFLTWKTTKTKLVIQIGEQQDWKDSDVAQTKPALVKSDLLKLPELSNKGWKAAGISNTKSSSSH